MRQPGKKKKVAGINITVSREAHTAISDRAREPKKRRSIREQVNIDYKLPIDS